MNKEKFGGIFPALLTPFGNDGSVNEKELEKLVKFDLGLGAKGFYVCGSTAEAFFLTVEERMRIMEVVRNSAPEATLIAHVGSLNETEAASLAVRAKELSYDAVSSVAPFYYKFSFEEIKGYYFRLADAAGLKMLVYHFPAFSGVQMGLGEMSAFLGDGRFLGLKYTSNDFFTMERCKAFFPDKVIYNGFDEMFLAGLAMGADGGIGSTYNFMADRFVKIKSLFEEGKIKDAQKVQSEANAIIAVLCGIGVIGAEKEVLCQMGFDFGSCRQPFAKLTGEQKDLIAKEIIPKIEKRV
ncbi:MAG: N-acetylneuraminate lyase [Clostridia bacterium]|nr:N-acetylneuraminate lyase [Clostridia bacterium]